MRRAVTVLALTVLVPLGAGRLAAQQADAAPIAAERARSIALEQVPNQQGVLSQKLKHKKGVLVYELDIETPGPGHQEVRVDAHTGAVVDSDHENDLPGKIWTKVGGAAKQAGQAAKHAADRVFSAAEVPQANPAFPEQRAREKARERIPGTTVADIDLETENGVLVWEVELKEGPSHDEVVIDATTGSVLRVKRGS